MTKETDALFGAPIEVTTEDGKTLSVTLRQFRVRDYERARQRIEDEAALIDLACDKPAGWSLTLTPESYHALAERLPEVNALFFAACARWARTRLDLLPAELRGALTASPGSSPAPPPPPG